MNTVAHGFTFALWLAVRVFQALEDYAAKKQGERGTS